MPRATKSLLQEAQREHRAVMLVRAGFRSGPIRLETGLAERLIRELYKEVHGVAPPAGKKREIDSLLWRAVDRDEALLFLWIYEMLNPEAHHSADIDALLRAHQIYLSMRGQWLSGPPFGIEDCWTLARGYCTGELYISVCPGRNRVPALAGALVPPRSCQKACGDSRALASDMSCKLAFNPARLKSIKQTASDLRPPRAAALQVVG